MYEKFLFVCFLYCFILGEKDRVFLSAYVMSNGLFWKRSLHAIMSKTEESRQISETWLASHLQTGTIFSRYYLLYPHTKCQTYLRLVPENISTSFQVEFDCMSPTKQNPSRTQTAKYDCYSKRNNSSYPISTSGLFSSWKV